MCNEDDEFYPTGGPGHEHAASGAFDFHCAQGPRAPGERGFNVNVGLDVPQLLPQNLMGDGSVVAPPPAPAPAGAMISDTLRTGAYLSAHASDATNRVPDMQSPNKRAILVFQSDGNLVLYDANAGALWASGTNGRGGKRAVVQDDGNFVIYDGQNRPLFATNTSGKGPGAYLKVQDDGNLVLYAASGAPLWASGTNGRLTPVGPVMRGLAAPLVLAAQAPVQMPYNPFVEAPRWVGYYLAVTDHLKAGEPLASIQASLVAPLPPVTPSSLRIAAAAARGQT